LTAWLGRDFDNFARGRKRRDGLTVFLEAIQMERDSS
jgi:hypothetical protein